MRDQRRERAARERVGHEVVAVALVAQGHEALAAGDGAGVDVEAGDSDVGIRAVDLAADRERDLQDVGKPRGGRAHELDHPRAASAATHSSASSNGMVTSSVV